MNFGNSVALATLPLPFTTLGLSLFTISDRYVPELYIATWLLIVSLSQKKRFLAIRSFFLYKPLILCTALIICISLLSGFGQNFSFVPFYGRLRALLAFSTAAIAVWFLTRKYGHDRTAEVLSMICASACVMYILAALRTAGGDQTKASVSMICFSLATCLMVERRNIFLAMSFALLASFAAYLSFFRQNYISAAWNDIATIGAALYISFYSRKSGFRLSKQAWTLIVIPVFTLVVASASWNMLSDFLASSESRYIQSIGKTNDLIALLETGQLDASGASRMENYMYFFDQAIYYLLPNGSIDDGSIALRSRWGGTAYYAGGAVIRDSMVVYFIVTFGIIISFYLVVFGGLKMAHLFLRAPYIALTRFIFLLPPMALFVLVDGATMTQLQKSAFFGLAIGFVTQSIFKPLRYAH